MDRAVRCIRQILTVVPRVTSYAGVALSVGMACICVPPSAVGGNEQVERVCVDMAQSVCTGSRATRSIIGNRVLTDAARRSIALTSGSPWP
jgi:hypothetical protein